MYVTKFNNTKIGEEDPRYVVRFHVEYNELDHTIFTECKMVDHSRTFTNRTESSALGAIHALITLALSLGALDDQNAAQYFLEVKQAIFKRM